MNGIYVSLVVIVAIPAFLSYLNDIFRKEQTAGELIATALWWIALGIFLHLLET